MTFMFVHVIINIITKTFTDVNISYYIKQKYFIDSSYFIEYIHISLN